MRSLFAAAVVAACLVGCVRVEHMPLSSPVDGEAEAVRVRASSVSASAAFIAQRTSSPEVIAVTVSARNDGTETAMLDLDHASLVFADPGGELREVALSAMSSGPGQAPRFVDLNGPVRPIALARGETKAFWVAFRAFEPLDQADVPRRIRLRIPLGQGAQPIDLILAEPATARPRWVHPPMRTASYAGVSAIGTPFDEASFGILRTSSKTVTRRLVFGPSLYLGVRGGEIRGEPQRTIACCDLGVSFDVSVNALRGTDSSFGPYFSYQGIFALESGRTDKAAWHGPAVGLQFFSTLLEPIHAGALPVRPTATPLGYSSFTVAYVHLFRRGNSGGSPGMLLLFEHTLPEL